MSPLVSLRLLLTQSDTRLVELARAGHERAFEALVARYRRQLLSYCRRLLLPHDRAEDVLQQGLLQAWLALREGAQVQEVKPWLYRVIHNAAVNALRRSGYNHAELTEALSGADAPAEDLDRRIAVREALAGLAALPPMQREALLRTAVDGSSYQDAAATLGLSEPALRGLVHRARSTLRAASTALTPAPLLSWALGSGADAPLASRIVELSPSGGTAGLTGLLLKAGATAVTAGVLVGGVATHHPRVTIDMPDHAHSSATTENSTEETRLRPVALVAKPADRSQRSPMTADGSGSGGSHQEEREHHRGRQRRYATQTARTPPPTPIPDALLTSPTTAASQPDDGKGDRPNAGSGHDGASNSTTAPGSSDGSASNGGDGNRGTSGSSPGPSSTGGGQDSSGSDSKDGGSTGSDGSSGASSDSDRAGSGDSGLGSQDDGAESPEQSSSSGSDGNSRETTVTPKTAVAYPGTNGEAPTEGN